ncbi:MAG: hypothetical protein M3525_11130 [Acidobacteriota bacterium]|nr:hypothetical protein [Acidobacteriota bacterium]
MKHIKSKKHSSSFCPKCSIKFQKRRLKCPFCRTLIAGNLPVMIFFILGVAAVLLTITILETNYF